MRSPIQASAEAEPGRVATALGKLNVFQRAMLQWNDLAPYNAIHVVRIPAMPDLERLQSTLSMVVARHGLGEISLHRKAGTYSYGAAPDRIEITRIPGDGTFESLAGEIARQLNLAFPSSGAPFFPFRFFAAEGADFFSLGVTYFHVVADAEAVVMLLKDIATAYVSPDAGPLQNPFDLYPPRRDRLRDGGLAVAFRKLAAFPATWRKMQQSDRYACTNAQDFTLGFTFFSISAGGLRRLAATAKSWHVTINDLFLAIMLECVSPFAAARVNNRQRRSISVGCIVNLRRQVELPQPATFGLFLGSFSVTHEVPSGIALKELARAVRDQTRRVKEDGLCLGMPAQMITGRIFLSLFSPARRATFYAKQYPLYAGLTNMNLNPLWREPLGKQPLNYFRAVCTGPVAPLVFSITTAGDIANVGVSYRTSVFTEENVARIREHFLKQIGELSP